MTHSAYEAAARRMTAGQEVGTGGAVGGAPAAPPARHSIWRRPR
ncbi:hypothetical protein ABT256_09905 [Amycolatopsis japonica]